MCGPGKSDEDPQGEWHHVGDLAALDDAPDARLHTSISGRYISIIRYAGRLHCIDSVCFHAGGPLALGEIEEIGTVACLVCPWHFAHVALHDGRKWYQAAQPGEDGKLQAGQWESMGQRQRVHQVENRKGALYVKLNLLGEVASDEYACKPECGARVKDDSMRVNVALADKDNAVAPSRSPRSGSPMRGRSGETSPRGSPSVDVAWPSDLIDERPSYKRRSSSLPRTPLPE